MIAVRLTAATANPAKLREIQRMAGDVATVVPLPLDPDDPAFAALSSERGASIEEIAVAKATGWSRALLERGLASLTIATDGGLLIPALGEAWDPRRTRRFAGDRASDLDRSGRLLALAADLTGPERRIAWVEAVAIADRGTLVGVWSASGRPGRLASTLRPDLLEQHPGFWVPALWEVPERDGRRLAELTDDERERLGDHWAALREPVREGLRTYLRALDLTTRARGSSDQEM
jgi:inosine/xanthosine triphosphate pyrophosphatase family protein